MRRIVKWILAAVLVAVAVSVGVVALTQALTQERGVSDMFSSTLIALWFIVASVGLFVRFVIDRMRGPDS